MDDHGLGNRVRHALTLRGLHGTHVEDAVATARGGKRAGLRGLVGDVVAGRREPTAGVLLALARALRVAPGWLLAGDGDIEPGGGVATHESLPGWAAAAQEETRRDRLPGWAIRAVGRAPVVVAPAVVTSDFVFSACAFWLLHAPEEVRLAAKQSNADAVA